LDVADYDWNNLRFTGGVVQIDDGSPEEKAGKRYWLNVR